MQKKVIRDVISIDVENGQVVKKIKPDEFEVLLAKQKQLEQIYAGDRKVNVPRLLKYDEAKLELTYEYIEGLASVRSLLKRRELAVDLVERIGAGIALAHRDLKLPKSLTRFLPAPFDQFTTETAYLHLDFNTVNVQYCESQDCVYLIDWELTPMLKGNANFGSVYFDLSFFASHLFFIEPYIFTNVNFKNLLATKFLQGYQSARNSLNFKEFKKVGQVYLETFKGLERKKLVKLARFFNFNNFQKFITNLVQQ